MKSTLIFSCALPLDHHPPTSVTLSATTPKFFLSPLSKAFLSLHAAWSQFLSLGGASLPLSSCLQLSCTPDLPHWHLTRCISCPSAFFTFLSPAGASPGSLSLPLLLPGAPRSWYHGELSAASACWHLSVPQELHTLPPRPGCSHSTLWWEKYLSWGEN